MSQRDVVSQKITHSISYDHELAVPRLLAYDQYVTCMKDIVS